MSDERLCLDVSEQRNYELNIFGRRNGLEYIRIFRIYAIRFRNKSQVKSNGYPTALVIFH